MHDDRTLDEARITRELHERVMPLVHADVRPFAITAGPTRDEQAEFSAGSRWGAPWGTTWFTFTGTIPQAWAERRVEATIDLGFHPNAAGFQCEGLIVDDAGRPVQGIHPRRTNIAVDARPGPIELVLEAASNPSFPPFRPSPLGSLETAGEQPLYTFREASLVLVDSEAEALVHDLDVLDGLMRTFDSDDPRRARFRLRLTEALDLFPDVAAMRERLAGLLATAPAASAHRVIATGHAHIDTAWLWPIRETIRKCTRTFASAVRLMDDYPEYRFTCSQAQQYAWIEERHPELFEQITVKVRGGQWLPVGGMWVEADMNLPSGESLARQIVHGQRYFDEHFGLRSTEVWIPDVFGYPASLPQIFAAGGMPRFVTQKLSWNHTNRFPHQTFLWEGIDGTRVLTHFPPVDTYNAEVTPAETVRSTRRFLDAAWSDWSLMPFGHGDGGGGPTREMLERARRLGDIDGSPRVSIGSPSEFFERVEREILTGAPVPVWRGELYFETHRGTLTSQLRTKIGNRRCERLLREVELWSAALGRHAGVDHLWQEVLTQQFHDIIPGSSIAWVHADAEAVHTSVAETLEARIDGLLSELLSPGINVANAAGVDRDEIVVVADAPGVGHQVVEEGFAVRAVAPANGVGGLADPEGDDRVVVGDSAMTNRHLALRWDDDGGITSLIAVDHAREIVPSGERFAVLELAPDRPVHYDAWDLESWTPGLGEPLGAASSVEIIDRGPLLGRVRVTYEFGPSTAAVTYAMRAGSARLDVELDLDWHHSEHLLSIGFPLDVRADTAACDIQFGHVRRPTHASSSWDAAKFEVCAHRFVDVSEPSFGVAVLNDGRYGHGLFGGRVRVSLARAARYPDPDADQGRHRVGLAVLPHGAGLVQVVGEAERLNVPVRVASGQAAAVGAPIVAIDGAGAAITAIKVADDDSRDLVVRLHESLGDRSAVTLSCDRRILTASRCNLLEEPESALDTSDGIVALTLRPFEIATIRLTRSSLSAAG